MKTSGTLFWGVDYVVSVNGGGKILGNPSGGFVNYQQWKNFREMRWVRAIMKTR